MNEPSDSSGLAEALKATLRTFGFAALVVLGLQFLTGIALSLHYVPTPEYAYDSVRVLQSDVAGGALNRALHHWGTWALVALILVQMLRILLFRSYQQPHRLTWWTGIALLLLVVAMDSTGQLLRWDEQAMLATEVRSGIVGSTPVLGATARSLMLGGEQIGAVTLTRFHVLHVVILPLLLIGTLIAHFWLLRRHGLGTTVAPANVPGRPWFPDQLVSQALFGVLACGALFFWSATHAAPLGGMAVAGDADFEASPEWYMLWLNQLLKVFGGDWQVLGTFVVPSLILLWLAVIPLVDPAGARWYRRAVVLVGTLAILAGVAKLTSGALENEPENREPLPVDQGLTDDERQGYVALRQQKCLDCHLAVIYDRDEAGKVIGQQEWGTSDHDAPHLGEILVEDLGDFAALLEDPQEALGDEDSPMPSYDHVPLEQRRQIGMFITRWVELRDKRGSK